jgi:UDP-N-acetylmuramate--alanine ligase
MKKKIFFIGIQGIGMSALALYARKHDYSVGGVDKNSGSETETLLLNAGIAVFQEQTTDPKIVEEYDLIIITNTVQPTNLFFLHAHHAHIPIIKRSQFLSYMLKNKYIVAITGSHGKTTTTSLIGDILCKSHPKKATVFVGGILKEYRTNVIINKKNLAVVEADDAYRSFLDLRPFISIITSISLEHVETYKNLTEIIQTFAQFALQTNKNGFIIMNIDSDNLLSAYKLITKKRFHSILTYGFNEKADYQIVLNSDNRQFTIIHNKIPIGTFKTPLLGMHNIQNTTAAILASRLLKISRKKIQKTLSTFQGVSRRFEYCGLYKDSIPIYDDYGHHPNEIDAVLKTIGMQNKQVIIFFQPHKYERTRALWHDFIAVFTKHSTIIESLYITDVYGIEEKPDATFNSPNLVKAIYPKIPTTAYIPYSDNFAAFQEEIAKHSTCAHGRMILTLGAGIMNRWAMKMQHI